MFLYFRQRQLIYRPAPELSLLPSTPDFDMPYQDVWIAIGNDQIHSWWIPADESQRFSVLDNEPAHVLSQPKVMLYFCGVGNNMGDYNYLSRAAAFRQLGFSVLMFDYRGYGRSEGDFPHEAQLYADSEAVWAYLRNERGVAAEDILIYGESMGGAIALNLAINHPDASGLIMQSSFTSMAAAIKHRPLASLFPIDGILHEAFNSIDKIEHLKMPVLFIHGTEDSVVPVSLSQALYEKAPAAKQLARIPNADHVSIYRPEASYFKTIDQFVRDVIGQDVTVRDVVQ
ncbi:MAG: alpha/beta hydrolase [Phormidesmis sp.]